MTLIEIRPDRRGWKVFEAPGVEPVFLTKEQALSYAQSRATFRSERFAFLTLWAHLNAQFRLVKRIENSDFPSRLTRTRSANGYSRTRSKRGSAALLFRMDVL